MKKHPKQCLTVVEVEILPLAVSEQMGVISYSPLGAGLLTGKYGVNKRPEQGRLVEDKRYTDRYLDEMNFDVADRFSAYAAVHGIDPSTLSVAWVMSNPAITAPIIGARSLEQLEHSLAAMDVDMTPEWRNEISSLFCYSCTRNRPWRNAAADVDITP